MVPKALKTALSLFTLAAVVAVGVSVPAGESGAVAVGNWASWAPLTGSSGAYESSVTLAGQPAFTATVSSTSRSGSVGVISGASTWLSEGTPVGAKYGSSKNQPYLNLRPRVDTATGSSSTTYHFAVPTPGNNWAFVLGDIDADQVQVTATDVTGAELTAADLGFQGGFNYCAPGVVGKPSCTGDATDVPTWDPATRTLTGNAAALDTQGSSAWFEPNKRVSTLTFTFTRRAGFPVYQTWFVNQSRDVTGTVTHQSTGPVAGQVVNLLDGAGQTVATTTTAVDGSFAFTGYFATGGFQVSVVPPPGTVSVDSPTKQVDLSSTDGVADFTLRDIIPVAVSGPITNALTGTPMVGVSVSIPDLGLTTVTGPDGVYRFDVVTPGTHDVVPATPTGFTANTPPVQVTVPAGSETPIADVAFQFTPNPTISGTITAAGSPVGAVVVTATNGTDTFTTTTAPSGTYAFALVPPGTYTVTPQAPAGFTVSGASSATPTVTANTPNVDFQLVKDAVPGTIAGTVTSGSAPVPSASVAVTGPGGTVTVITDADGIYAAENLAPGTYTISVTPPSGYSLPVPTELTATVTAAGETIVDQDFTLTQNPQPSPTAPTPTTTPTTSPTPTQTPTPTTAPTPAPTTTSPSATATAGPRPVLSRTGAAGSAAPAAGAVAALLAGALLMRRRATQHTC